jgi:acyl-CoA dehydrogenase
LFDFSLSDEEELIRRAAADFGRNRLGPRARANEAAGVVDAALDKEFADAGFGAIELAAAGLGPFAGALALEGLAAADAAALLALDRPGPALFPLVEMGGAEGRTLVESLDPKARAWVVIDRDERFHMKNARARGAWPWVPAHSLELLVILSGDAAYVVREGMRTSPVVPCALHAAGASALEVDAPVAVRFENARGASRAVARLRLYAAAILVGVARASFDYAKRYAEERFAFGRPVAHHQGMAFLIAEIAMRIDAARLAVWRAAWVLERDGDPTEAAAQALVEAIEVALEAGEQGVQLLGGHGYMHDHPVEKWMREARTLAQLWGGRTAALEDLAACAFDARWSVGFEPTPWKERAL